MGKSCTWTGSGRPFGRSSRPPFLKSPTSSFFFVSTEITGWPAAWNAFTSALMYSNCASRSGWLTPSRVLLFACRLKPRRRSRRPTNFWPAMKPRSASAADRRRWLLLTHSKAASGSPRIDDCTSSFNASKSPGWVSIAGLLPPPRRRTRPPNCSAPASRSARPRPMVLRATPVARETSATPPRPAARASQAANRRLSFSFRTGESASKRAVIAAVSIIQAGYSLQPSSHGNCRIRSLRSCPTPDSFLPIRLFGLGPLVANWTDKAANIREIARRLSIGLDSLVFVDDNPAERAIVRRELPMVAVPELPADPALFAACLADAGYFEAVRLTEEDRRRAAQYQADLSRQNLAASATDLDGY